MKKKKIPILVLILLFLFAILTIWSMLAPVLYPLDLGDTDLNNRLQMPSIFGISDSGYLLGTDYLGRDLAIRLLYATRVSITLAFTGLFFALLLGVTLGVIAGVFGGIADDMITFMINTRHSIPSVLIGIIVATVFGSTKAMIIILTALIQWTKFARQTRAKIIQVREESFIESSRAIGSSRLRILWEHMLPNIASPLIVVATMNLSSIILFESTLSYLGIGIQPPNVSLGVMVSAGRNQLISQWWQAIIPVTVIVLIVMTASLTGDWLRDKLDPKLRSR